MRNERIVQTMKYLGGFILVLGIAAVVLGLFWSSARYLLNSFSQLDSEVASALIAASGAGLISVLTVIYGQRRVKERELTEAHRPQKVKVYGSYMNMMFDNLRNVKESKSDKITPKMVNTMLDFKRDLIIWGSPGVIKAYMEWEDLATKDTAVGIRAWDKLLREFRKDLGNSNWLLAEGDLIKLILDQEAKAKFFDN